MAHPAGAEMGCLLLKGLCSRLSPSLTLAVNSTAVVATCLIYAVRLACFAQPHFLPCSCCHVSLPPRFDIWMYWVGQKVVRVFP